MTWKELLKKEPECDLCQSERQRRCQVLDKSPEATQRLLTQFADAPYVHPYNQPKYQAQICHVVNFARAERRKMLWRIAQDWPITAEEMDLDADRLAAAIFCYSNKLALQETPMTNIACCYVIACAHTYKS